MDDQEISHLSLYLCLEDAPSFSGEGLESAGRIGELSSYRTLFVDIVKYKCSDGGDYYEGGSTVSDVLIIGVL